ncbi:uncharacterized protein CIMG_06798 [Coccidioides immitis RS]|uniref:Uncharacterized protein n=1 Tax=Coccidioides immitis (strain RS) TaxID=246410 RepID=J3K8Y4_COCIM|nr:uncharacterized protein CIMG_06798 [Coccidioides immitis RS]EAS31319.3 hypothetical protein CIMG_06798 [Coccidioides immitis RS]
MIVRDLRVVCRHDVINELKSRIDASRRLTGRDMERVADALRSETLDRGDVGLNGGTGNLIEKFAGVRSSARLKKGGREGKQEKMGREKEWQHRGDSSREAEGRSVWWGEKKANDETSDRAMGRDGLIMDGWMEGWWACCPPRRRCWEKPVQLQPKSKLHEKPEISWPATEHLQIDTIIVDCFPGRRRQKKERARGRRKSDVSKKTLPSGAPLQKGRYLQPPSSVRCAPFITIPTFDQLQRARAPARLMTFGSMNDDQLGPY